MKTMNTEFREILSQSEDIFDLFVSVFFHLKRKEAKVTNIINRNIDLLKTCKNICRSVIERLKWHPIENRLSYNHESRNVLYRLLDLYPDEVVAVSILSEVDTVLGDSDYLFSPELIDITGDKFLLAPWIRKKHRIQWRTETDYTSTINGIDNASLVVVFSNIIKKKEWFRNTNQRSSESRPILTFLLMCINLSRSFRSFRSYFLQHFVQTERQPLYPGFMRTALCIRKKGLNFFLLQHEHRGNISGMYRKNRITRNMMTSSKNLFIKTPPIKIILRPGTLCRKLSCRGSDDRYS